jgi:hypothetical protein
MALKLGEATKHCQHQPPMGRCCIGPEIAERAEAASASPIVARVLSKSRVELGQPIKLRYQNRITRL